MSDENKPVRIMSRRTTERVLFYVVSDDGQDYVPLVAFNPRVYHDHTKLIDGFIRDLALALVRKGAGEEVQLDIMRGSELN